MRLDGFDANEPRINLIVRLPITDGLSSEPSAMKRYLPFVVIVLVALLAIGAGAMLYRAERHPLPAAGDAPTFVEKIEEKTAHVRGGA